MRYSTASALLLASVATAREVPANLKAFYDANQSGDCAQKVGGPFNSGQGESDSVYCQDQATSAMYLKDVTKEGFADMDIVCDGAGACEGDGSFQGETAFMDQVAELSGGAVTNLNAFEHTFVVFGNDNKCKDDLDDCDPNKEAFDPQSIGVQPLSVVAVVCGEQLVYGVWGDVNGGIVTGEASISLARKCFPDETIDGGHGHEQHDVLYIAFPGDEAVARDAAWDAHNAEAFEASLEAIAQPFVDAIGSGSAADANITSRIMRGRL